MGVYIPRDDLAERNRGCSTVIPRVGNAHLQQNPISDSYIPLVFLHPFFIMNTYLITQGQNYLDYELPCNFVYEILIIVRQSWNFIIMHSTTTRQRMTMPSAKLITSATPEYRSFNAGAISCFFFFFCSLTMSTWNNYGHDGRGRGGGVGGGHLTINFLGIVRLTTGDIAIDPLTLRPLRWFCAETPSACGLT